MSDKSSSQMLKGLLDGCVLHLISQGEVYGYQLNEALKAAGLDMVAAGTIYPLLIKLEQQGLIQAQSRPSPEGPNRKYYYITPAGLQALSHFKTQWQTLALAINTLLEG